MEKILKDYLNSLQGVLNRGDAREESFYEVLADLMRQAAEIFNLSDFAITILPKKTEAGNPDFRIWNGKNHIIGYIEAKHPQETNLELIYSSEQLKRYTATFPNLILTNFYEFWLIQHGEIVNRITIGRAINAITMEKTPPVENPDAFGNLLKSYFSFHIPAIESPKELASILARKTRFLRDEVILLELAEEEKKQQKQMLFNFYESFKRLLINNLTEHQFADLYAQTLTYGIFAARTRSQGEFNRELIYKYIPNTLGILKNIFKFISYEEPPKALQVLIDDIAEILYVTDVNSILHKYYIEGKGLDPIVYFYETFLNEYDPELREKRGVYYTPEPVVRYIVRCVNTLLKLRFGLSEGLASSEVTLLDPAAGTLTFPAEAIKIAVQEFKTKYGSGSINKLIKEHILPHFYAIELMMAPYTVGHLKISYLLTELGYPISEEERFQLYLSNTLEPDIPEQIELPFLFDITEECILANKIKDQEPILVIMGNPPYSGESENKNKWIDNLLKADIDGAQSYYKVDGKPLQEKNPKWLQDDYVKFLRFAQWKISKAGKGIVGMITNHGYLDNPTFRGMRQSLLTTFDEIYILDLHGNSKKKEKTPEGTKDENVFDIQQGTAVVLMVKKPDAKKQICHYELYGLREEKYSWLNNTEFKAENYQPISPHSPFYLFKPETSNYEYYLKWSSLPEIFPLNSVGVVTSRDALTIQPTKEKVRKTIHHFASLDASEARIAYKLRKDSRDWKISLAQKDLKDSGLKDENIVPILYRPFDIRYTYYTGNSRGFHCRTRKAVMQHLLKENIALISVRQVKTSANWQHIFIGNCITESCVISNNTSEISYVYPLQIVNDPPQGEIITEKNKAFNYSIEVLNHFKTLWGKKFQPEQLFFYIYAVLHSNIYRRKYAEYLRIDFPRIPFTENYSFFSKLANLGKELADLHLLKSPLLDPPVVKYQGTGPDDSVEKVLYNPAERTIRINKYKYFEGISEEVWNFSIGGYQVLAKYLKDRKGRTLEDPILVCKIATALIKTLELQKPIDNLYSDLESAL